jgi:hypothetical protein
LVALVLGFVTAAIVLIFERCIRRSWRDKILVEVARFNPKDETLFDIPLSHVLRSFGEQMGHKPRMGETDADYCMRVFGVEAARPDMTG